jgi:hypothetical protein
MDTVEMTSGGMIHIPSFKTIGLGVQAILRCYNLRGFRVDITDGKDL